MGDYIQYVVLITLRSVSVKPLPSVFPTQEALDDVKLRFVELTSQPNANKFVALATHRRIAHTHASSAKLSNPIPTAGASSRLSSVDRRTATHSVRLPLIPLLHSALQSMNCKNPVPSL